MNLSIGIAAIHRCYRFFCTWGVYLALLIGGAAIGDKGDRVHDPQAGFARIG